MGSFILMIYKIQLEIIKNVNCLTARNCFINCTASWIKFRLKKEKNSQWNHQLHSIQDISGNKCTIEETKINDNDIYKRFICDYNLKISNIPNIHFTVDDFDIILLNNDMFRLVQISNEYKFICKIVLDSRYTYWNIGEPLIKNYDMIFNADDCHSLDLKRMLIYTVKVGSLCLFFRLSSLLLSLQVYISLSTERNFSIKELHRIRLRNWNRKRRLKEVNLVKFNQIYNVNI